MEHIGIQFGCIIYMHGGSKDLYMIVYYYCGYTVIISVKELLNGRILTSITKGSPVLEKMKHTHIVDPRTCCLL